VTDWRPSATIAALRQRAAVLATLREYFAGQGVLEVETPVLARHTTSEPALAAFIVPDPDGTSRYLQTSPEACMKRLLAAGSGDIYQVAHAFRREEVGALHLEEFTLVEWYRLGFDHHRLMDDVENLLRALGFVRPIERHPYAELCRRHTGLDPLSARDSDLLRFAQAHGAMLGAAARDDRALLLDFLFAFGVLPCVAGDGAFFIYDFPVEHAAYARLRGEGTAVAERFELIIDGVEIANGYHEVTDPAEQAARHTRENLQRRTRGLTEVAPDPALHGALAHGLPGCAGVALGFDRTLMALSGAGRISEVVAFGADIR
jgi:lysyl-tRNA synthetase class 2